MANKLFVGGLPYSTTEEELRALFEAIGNVEAVQIIIDRELNRSKGFGFVTMASDDDAAAAVQALDGKEFEGRRLSVNEARPQERRPRSFDGDNGGGRRDNRDSRDNGGRRY